jgi:Raf kinase inhibitor-like YbhB/YbcL family protein
MKREIINVSFEKFVGDGCLPEKYSCYGGNINPPLRIENIPDGTKSLGLIMESCADNSTSLTHWVVWNLPATAKIHENEQRGELGTNDFGGVGYCGPCSFENPLQCTFKIFAFDRLLHFPFNPVTKFDLYASIIYYGLGHGQVRCQYSGKKAADQLVRV